MPCAFNHQDFARMWDELHEVRLEISRINQAAGETVFNPAATQALESVMNEIGGEVEAGKEEA